MPKQQNKKTGKIGISWCDYSCSTWWGCVETDPEDACKFCYARELSKRFGHDLWGKNKPRRFFGDRPYNDLIKWNRTALQDYGRPARVFINSMSDTFEDRRDLDEHRTRLFNLVPELPNLELLLLTKRIEAVHRLVPKHWMDLGFPMNVRIGTTVENQQWYDLRVPTISRLPAKNFLSIEPLLGPIDAIAGNTTARIDWAIVGSESGARRRKTETVWVEDLAAQFRFEGTPFFVKQLELNGKVEKDITKFPSHLRIQQFPYDLRVPTISR